MIELQVTFKGRTMDEIVVAIEDFLKSDINIDSSNEKKKKDFIAGEGDKSKLKDELPKTESSPEQPVSPPPVPPVLTPLKSEAPKEVEKPTPVKKQDSIDEKCITPTHLTSVKNLWKIYPAITEKEVIEHFKVTKLEDIPDDKYADVCRYLKGNK